MISIRLATVLALLTLIGFSSSVSAQETNKADFATDDEIRLVITQIDRAIQQYKPLLDQEEALFGSEAKEATSKDRQVISGLEKASQAFKTNPQGFNGPLGFVFFEWIDDADRNALLCAGGAASQAVLALISGNKDKAQELVALSTGCTNAANLFYTVSENAGSLYTRYAEGEEKLAQQGLEAASKCVEALKKTQKQ